MMRTINEPAVISHSPTASFILRAEDESKMRASIGSAHSSASWLRYDGRRAWLE